MGNVIVSNITRTPFSNGSNWGSVPATTDLASIYMFEDFESQALGSDPEAIAGFANVTPGSVISTDQALGGTKSYKDVSLTAGTTEWANGFTHSIPSDLVEGDEAWLRIPVFLPIGSDLSIPTGGRLKWFRWRTETAAAANKGYSDIYYDDVNGRWEYIKETIPQPNYADAYWLTLATGVGGPFDHEYGKWVTWELYTKFSATAGVIRMWKDGVLMADLAGVHTLDDATDLVKSMYFRTYWNGTGIPKQQDWFYDNIAMALNGAGRSDSQYLATDAAGNRFIGVT
jgi:hypothetical protein|tara:strand:+ start:262 stop:1116 length:855 start_codon:yes stop_codon:yes gene_type:complete